VRQLVQPSTAFVYCNRQSPPAAGGRRETVNSTARLPGACATERAPELRRFSRIFISLRDGTTREIK